MTDYMQKARGFYASQLTTELARTLEALDTERTRADEAEKRERELREALEMRQDFSRLTLRENLRRILSEWHDVNPATFLDKIMEAIPVGAYPPEPDPLVEAIEAMRQTAKELRECPNRDCNLVMQAIMWEKRAADVEARLSIVKGES